MQDDAHGRHPLPRSGYIKNDRKDIVKPVRAFKSMHPIAVPECLTCQAANVEDLRFPLS